MESTKIKNSFFTVLYRILGLALTVSCSSSSPTQETPQTIEEKDSISVNPESTDEAPSTKGNDTIIDNQDTSAYFPIIKNTDWEKEGMRGRVKESRETRNGIVTHTMFDPNGNLTKRFNHGYKHEYTYYNNGKIKEISKYRFDKDINKLVLECKNTYNYDSNGLLTSEFEYYNEKYSTYTIYEYDENGRKIKESNYQKGIETPNLDQTFFYDRKGRLTKRVGIAKKDFVTCDGGTFFYEYDENNNNIGIYWINDKKEKQYSYKMTYDDNGRLTGKQVMLDCVMDHTEYMETFAYDENGHETEYYHYSVEGEFNYRIFHRYNKIGNKIERDLLNHDQYQCIIKYIYDNRGNVIKEIDTSSRYPKRETTYEYDYYE